jgi:CHAT domain-containing protein/Flp pilus assembly protein TadD
MRLHPTFAGIASFVVLCLPISQAPLNPAKSNSVAQEPAEIRQSHPVRATTAVDDAASLKQKAEVLTKKARTLAQTQSNKNFATAVAMFRESARLFEEARANQDAADAYLEAGQIYFTLSRYDDARRAYRQALKLGQAAETRCTALSRMARAYATTGPVSDADRYSSEAVDSCKALSEDLRAQALEARGEALDSADEHAKSVESLRQAESLFDAAGDTAGEAQTQLILSLALFADGRQTEALEAADAALGRWSSMGDQYGVARVRSALGIFAITRGEFETAQCNYQIAEPILRRIGNKDDEASVQNGLGYASRETGDWEKSLEYYRKAKMNFAAVQDLLGEHEAITGMGKALVDLKEFQQLGTLSAAEERLALRAGDPSLIASSLGDMATAYDVQGRSAEAEKYYRRALETYRTANHLYGEGDILVRLGVLQGAQGQHSAAIATLQLANTLKEKTGQIEEVAKIQYELALIYRQMKRLDEARDAIEKTIEIVESQRLKISQFDSRASYFASVHRYYALHIQLLMLADQRDPGRGYSERAFEASEKSKLRSLLDLLTTSAQVAPCGELLQRQLQEARFTEVHLAGADQIEPLATPTLALKQVQDEIRGDDTILLEYALGDERSHVWIVDRHDITSYVLPDSLRINKLVSRLRQTLAPPQLEKDESATHYQERAREIDRKYQAIALQLSSLILGPIDFGRAKRVLIVPDGALQYVPFAALPLPARTGVKGHLIERFEVDILPSASVLGTLRKTTASRTPPTLTVAVLADPVFEQDDPRIAKAGIPDHSVDRDRASGLTRAIQDSGGSKYIPRLPASRDEAKAIAAIFSSTDPQMVHIALDFDANRDYVTQEGLARFRLIHFATHGVVDVQHPEMSGLILSLIDRTGRKQDGYLRLGDIYKLKLAADLVVLSSCDSALGKALESEGIIGLPRGFLYAGARSVIASLWKVNDEATAKLMSSLYTRLRRGESPGSALRGAQLEMIQDGRWSKPYNWAAFALQGDYR